MAKDQGPSRTDFAEAVMDEMLRRYAARHGLDADHLHADLFYEDDPGEDWDGSIGIFIYNHGEPIDGMASSSILSVLVAFSGICEDTEEDDTGGLGSHEEFDT